MTLKLNQVIAISDGTTSKAQSEEDRIFKTVQKPELFNGVTKTYTPKTEDGEQLPPESQIVQTTVTDILQQLEDSKTEFFDITAQRDFANTTAKANVELNGKVIISDAPVPYLLFLEKQLGKIRVVLEKLPVLDPSETWVFDSGEGVYKTAPQDRTRTVKISEPLVLYQATDKHPAQVQLASKDVVAGVWTYIKKSGAIPKTHKQMYLDSIDEVIKAVKLAREEANSAEAEQVKVGQSIFNHIFSRV
jgi:hypothetical protein